MAPSAAQAAVNARRAAHGNNRSRNAAVANSRDRGRQRAGKATTARITSGMPKAAAAMLAAKPTKVEKKPPTKARPMWQTYRADPAVKSATFPIRELPLDIFHIVSKHVIKSADAHQLTFTKMTLDAQNQKHDDLRNNQNWKIGFRPPSYNHDASGYNILEAWKQVFGMGYQFRRGMKQAMMDGVVLKLQHSNKDGDVKTVVIDAETDLIIPAFRSPETFCGITFHWSDLRRNDTYSGIDRDQVFEKFRSVALRSDTGAKNTLPFQCGGTDVHPQCQSPNRLCYREVAFFLDLFPNLQEMYLVVKAKGPNAVAWLEATRDFIERGKASTTRNPHRWEFEIPKLHTFRDACRAYVPLALSKIHWLSDPPEAWTNQETTAADLLDDVAKFYRASNPEFCRSFADRRAIKFGLLVELQQKPPQCMVLPAPKKDVGKDEVGTKEDSMVVE